MGNMWYNCLEFPYICRDFGDQIQLSICFVGIVTACDMSDRIARRWQEEIRKLKDYKIVEKEAKESFIPTYVYKSEYNQAMALKVKLMREHWRKPLEAAIPGQTISNDYGSCYYIQSEANLIFQKLDFEKSKQAILSNLKLIYGIGDVRERALKHQGYRSIEDLTHHPLWGESAQKFMDIFVSQNTISLQNELWHWLPKSHPLLLYLTGLHEMDDFVIFDVESMGLFERPIILVGVARPKPKAKKIVIHQYLLRDIADEPSALYEFISHLKGNVALITFNGRAFDIPYVEARLNFYGIGAVINKPHFDILHFARRVWQEKLPDCRLVTIENYIMRVKRENDIPAALVPDFYATYLRTKNVGPLIAIIEHNRDDLITLASVFSKLCESCKDESYY